MNGPSEFNFIRDPNSQTREIRFVLPPAYAVAHRSLRPEGATILRRPPNFPGSLLPRPRRLIRTGNKFHPVSQSLCRPIEIERTLRFPSG